MSQDPLCETWLSNQFFMLLEVATAADAKIAIGKGRKGPRTRFASLYSTGMCYYTACY